jgi:hypothetical protein
MKLDKVARVKPMWLVDIHLTFMLGLISSTYKGLRPRLRASGGKQYFNQKASFSGRFLVVQIMPRQ